jgi:endonuclease-3 related protein
VSRPSPAALAAPFSADVHKVYRALEDAYAGQTWHWMPGAIVGGPFEIIAGAVLVQHTTWTNAERALNALRIAGALNPASLSRMDEDQIAALVRVSGTPSVKARRLRAIAETIARAGGLAALLALPDAELRATLLATHGIGPETADAIALYAAGKPAFVIDNYTKRLFRRLALGPDGDSYDAWQRWFHDALPRDVALYRDYHAYIVLHGKALCRPAPRCAPCPLLARCPDGLRRCPEGALR